MADFARAMNTPPPDTTKPQEAKPVSAVQPAPPSPGRTPVFKEVADIDAANKRAAKNERDRQQRKAKRAADAKAKAKKAAPKKKKRSAKVAQERVAAQAAPKRKAKKKKAKPSPAARAMAAVYPPVRRRGRPPGAKNKPKVGLSVALVPAPGVLPKVAVARSLWDRMQAAILLLEALPEHARKTVLDVVAK